MKKEREISAPGPLEIFAAFLKLGLTAFGGPAMVAYIKDLAVKQKGWVKERDFSHGVALVQTIPGATAMQAAAYAGLRAAGPSGALCAYTGFSLPAFILMLILTIAYSHGQNLPAVLSLFSGLKVIVVAIVANAAINFGKKTIRSYPDALLTAAGAAYIILNGSPVTVIILSAIAGPLIYMREIRKGSKGQSQSQGAFDRIFLQRTFRFGIAVSACIAALLACLAYFSPRLATLGLIMTKIDFFAFGGGYASLPLMLHEISDARKLLDAKTLMDGIALGQVTPGPIVITATFVGYLLHGISGAVIATLCVFAPSFVVLLLITPWFDRVKSNAIFRQAMRGVLCSFVGLLVAVAVRFALAVQWQIMAVLISLAAFAALRFKVDILWVVVGGGLLSILLL